MKLLIPLAFTLGLSGCVAVPYDAPPTSYYGTAPVYSYDYPLAPAYVTPAPVYVGPPVHLNFGFLYRSGGHRHHHHHHLDGFRSHGRGFHGHGGFRGGFRGRGH